MCTTDRYTTLDQNLLIANGKNAAPAFCSLTDSNGTLSHRCQSLGSASAPCVVLQLQPLEKCKVTARFFSLCEYPSDCQADLRCDCPAAVTVFNLAAVQSYEAFQRPSLPKTMSRLTKACPRGRVP